MVVTYGLRCAIGLHSLICLILNREKKIEKINFICAGANASAAAAFSRCLMEVDRGYNCTTGGATIRDQHNTQDHSLFRSFFFFFLGSAALASVSIGT
jgi:hypothetical protein